ncbi:MAG: Holliday junction branch migration protein RuvA [Chitinophagaceae bacterium]|nr:Holliday junction branch migration protein RuvA [Chitinophagaceae bacterium]
MIAFLKGNFVRKTPALVHVDVNGVGYEVHISLNTYSSISGQDHGQLHTYFHVREDAQVLYGFYEEAEKDMFIQLLSVSGVGAATARMMLSSMKPVEIAKAISQGNTKLLESIKGIGKKSAERIVLELRDKVAKAAFGSNNEVLINNTLDQDALNALIALGISRSLGEQAIGKVRKSNPELHKIEDIIKQALKNI